VYRVGGACAHSTSRTAPHICLTPNEYRSELPYLHIPSRLCSRDVSFSMHWLLFAISVTSRLCSIYHCQASFRRQHSLTFKQFSSVKKHALARRVKIICSLLKEFGIYVENVKRLPLSFPQLFLSISTYEGRKLL
jgi:hypothetical protein